MYSRFQEKLREQRKNPETSRAGLKWESEEDCSLIDKVKSDKSFDEIAKEHQRTVGSIKTRLIIKAIDSLDNQTIEDAALEYKIEVSDIEEYQKIKFEREQKQQLNATIRRRNSGNRNNTVITLSTIHALLQQISNKLG